jgi:hypothetical protein
MSIAVAGVVWLSGFVLATLVAARARGGSIGLPLAYLFGLGLIHVPGAMVYADGDYAWFDPAWVQRGFELSAIGAGAFAIGLLLFHRLSPVPAPAGAGAVADDARPAATLAVGLACWLSLTVLGDIPSLGAVVAAGSQLVPVAIILGLWRAQASGRLAPALPWFAFAACLPLMTLGGKGFLGFGATMTIVVLFAAVALWRLWWRWLPLLPVLVFFGLSVFVTYMRDRGEIRELVWGGAALEARFERIATTVSTLEWFDADDFRHRMQVDRRLNQNWMVGAAAERLDGGDQAFAGGETLLWGVVALVPRAVWPGKPEVGGGGDLVSRFTGATFAEGTSVGAGQVLEFYVNFGLPGLVGCFVLFGFALGWLDSRAASLLRRADWRRFVFYATPGVAALQPGGNFAEITTSVAAAFLFGWLFLVASESWRRHDAATGSASAMRPVPRRP